MSTMIVLWIVVLFILWVVSDTVSDSLLKTLWWVISAIASGILYDAFKSSVARLRRISYLSRPPGWRLRRFADLCFSKKTWTDVFEPTLSDLQKEHFDALAAGRPWKARMVLARGYWSFWSAVAAQLPISFIRLVYKIWKTTNT